jgi:hypothetical protein
MKEINFNSILRTGRKIKVYGWICPNCNEFNKDLTAENANDCLEKTVIQECSHCSTKFKHINNFDKSNNKWNIKFYKDDNEDYFVGYITHPFISICRIYHFNGSSYELVINDSADKVFESNNFEECVDYLYKVLNGEIIPE